MSANGYHPTPVAQTKFASGASRKSPYTATAFEAFLYKPLNPGQLKLTIKLSVKLKQQSPRLITLDADNKPFFSAPWNATDWAQFIGECTAQANLWNNRFWIRPAKSFSQFDRKFDTFPGQAYRPNIRCDLVVDFNPGKDAFATIEVAHLNKTIMAFLGQHQGPGTFRSHAMLWDSLDGIPWALPYGAGANRPQKHYVIAHELGHLLGLGHIGVLRKTALCVLAQAVENWPLPETSPLSGGRNSLVCYGHGQARDIVDNIMGAGDKFTVDNAVPWLWAIMAMRGKPNDFPGWTMLTQDPGEGSWVKL